ncbi:unnamed protein product [Didymodactylos carnosus]|uniref:Uncharacterized protein n=1 Tax=Didymodactylos carnosus TaxID=1234261 RepID=A0A813SAA1_9BILA|nr:unnamed protein product [Didymodactylos carnosus]CAF1313203.1 unnamed protein product [Didymodactylos carnosus]CAF3576718.1 unnamed protein product [Didymodactylos carnosus]CAF4121680.1 unnamed protein product [Didymodactylos carnosus]
MMRNTDFLSRTATSSANDSIDLYTLLKLNEPEKRQSKLTGIPLKSDITKLLVPSYSKVFFTDGYTSLKQDDRYERIVYDDEMEVPCIGTDKRNFDLAEMVTFDIDGTSTQLPLMVKMVIIPQGAVNQREPPVIVRDVCVQCDDIPQSRRRTNGHDKDITITRAKSSDYLTNRNGFYDNINDEHLRCLSLTSSMTDDSYDNSSTVTQESSNQHRISHLLHRRQISTNNYLNRSEYYSIPYYQYPGRRYGPKHIGIQVNSNDLKNFHLHQSSYKFSFNKQNGDDHYSVTIIVPVKNRHLLFNEETDNHQRTNQPQIIEVKIPVNIKSKHTTVRYMNTKEYVTIKRTIKGQIIGDIE